MMKKLIIIVSLLISTGAVMFAQNNPVKSYYDNSGRLKSEINYSDSVRDGKAVFYYPNGNIKVELNYENGKVEGLVKEYRENGKLKITYNVESGKREGPASLFDSSGNYIKDITYENGVPVPENIEDTSSTNDSTIASTKPDTALQKVSEIKKKNAPGEVQEKNFPGQSELPSLQEKVESKKSDSESGYRTDAEIMPAPLGGMKTIYNRLVYSSDAKKNKVHGTVEVKAFVDEYGEVQKAEVVKGLGHGCDETARIAVYYTSFKPGFIKGNPVKAIVVIPIDFHLEK